MLLVFWRIIFLGMEISLGIVPFYVIIIICDLRKVFLRALKSYFIESHITFINKDTRARVSSFTFFLNLFLDSFKLF